MRARLAAPAASPPRGDYHQAPIKCREVCSETVERFGSCHQIRAIGGGRLSPCLGHGAVQGRPVGNRFRRTLADPSMGFRHLTALGSKTVFRYLVVTYLWIYGK